MPKRKPVRTVKVTTDVIREEEGGIYLRGIKVGETTSNVPHDEAVKQLQEAWDDDIQWANDLEISRVIAASVVAPHVKPCESIDDLKSPFSTLRRIDLGEGVRAYACPGKEASDEIKEAILALEYGRDLLRGGEIVRNWNRDKKSPDVLPGYVTELLRKAYYLGRLTERITVRPHEPNAATGRRVKGGSKKGGEISNLGATAEALRTATRFDELRKASPGRKVGSIVKDIIEEFGVSETTVYRHRRTVAALKLTVKASRCQ